MTTRRTTGLPLLALTAALIGCALEPNPTPGGDPTDRNAGSDGLIGADGVDGADGVGVVDGVDVAEGAEGADAVEPADCPGQPTCPGSTDSGEYFADVLTPAPDVSTSQDALAPDDLQAPDVEEPACDPGCTLGCSLDSNPDFTGVYVLGDWSPVPNLGAASAFTDALAAEGLLEHVEALFRAASTSLDLRLAVFMTDDGPPVSYAIDRQALCEAPAAEEPLCVVTATHVAPLKPSACPYHGAASLFPSHGEPASAALPWLLDGVLVPLEWTSLVTDLGSTSDVRLTGHIVAQPWLDRLKTACTAPSSEAITALCGAQASLQQLVSDCPADGCAVVLGAGFLAEMATLVVPAQD